MNCRRWNKIIDMIWFSQNKRAKSKKIIIYGILCYFFFVINKNYILQIFCCLQRRAGASTLCGMRSKCWKSGTCWSATRRTGSKSITSGPNTTRRPSCGRWLTGCTRSSAPRPSSEWTSINFCIPLPPRLYLRENWHNIHTRAHQKCLSRLRSHSTSYPRRKHISFELVDVVSSFFFPLTKSLTFLTWIF